MKLIKNARLKISAVVLPTPFAESLLFTVGVMAHIDEYLELPLMHRTQNFVFNVIKKSVEKDFLKMGKV